MVARTANIRRPMCIPGGPTELHRLAGAIAHGVLLLFSFEFIFVCFMFSGSFKEDPRFEWIGIDLTLLFGCISAAQGIAIVLTRRHPTNPCGTSCMVAGAAFCLYAFATVYWSLSDDYAFQKGIKLCTLNLWSLFAGSILITSSRKRAVRLIYSLIIFSSWICLESLLYYATNIGYGTIGRVDMLGAEFGYIGFGRIVGAGCVLAGVRLQMSSNSSAASMPAHSSAPHFLIFCFLTLGILIIGAKGPLVATVAALGVSFVLVNVLSRSAWRAKSIFLIAACIGGTIIIVMLWQQLLGEPPLVIRRILSFSSSSEYYDASGNGYTRIELVSNGFRYWLEEPLTGWGLGSYGVLNGNGDIRDYAHNVIAEILCELGVIGLLLASACAWLAHRVARQRSRCDVRHLFIALFIYALANSMVSGDLIDNRFLFLAVGLLAYRGRQSVCNAE